MKAGPKAKNRTEGSLHIQREHLTQTSFWHQAAGSMAPFELGSVSCQHSSQCLLPAGWGIPARQSLVPVAVLGPPTQASMRTWVPPRGRWGQPGSLSCCGNWDYCLYQGKRKKNYVLRAEEDKKSKEVAKSELSKQAIIYRPQNQC